MTTTIWRVLLAKPNDLPIYRDARVTGLTAILYGLPWSVLFALALAFVAFVALGAP